MKKTLDKSTKYYSVVKHEQEVMTGKLAVVRFSGLSNPLRGIHCNKETFSVDLLENTYAGKKRWGIISYSVKSKILAYYRLGSKDPTSALTLYALDNFISDHRIPRMIITDSNGVLVSGKNWKHYLGQNFTLLQLSESYKQNQNPVDRAIQNLKSGLSKISNACGRGVLS